MPWVTTILKPQVPGQDFTPTTTVVYVDPTTSHDLWNWATESNARSDLFSTLTTSPSSTTSSFRFTNSPLSRTNRTANTEPPPYIIILPIVLGVFIIFTVVMCWLGYKGKLGKANPYVRKMKKEQQLRRVEMVEANRRSRGVEWVDGKEVPIQREQAPVQNDDPDAIHVMSGARGEGEASGSGAGGK